MNVEDNRHPRGFWFIFWGELAERCSYYGMRAILTFYFLAIALMNLGGAVNHLPFGLGQPPVAGGDLGTGAHQEPHRGGCAGRR